MTTTFCMIVLALGLLVIWAWMTLRLVKLKMNVVINTHSRVVFTNETASIRLISWIFFYFGIGLMIGACIQIAMEV